jgi:hypothetical protein
VTGGVTQMVGGGVADAVTVLLHGGSWDDAVAAGTDFSNRRFDFVVGAVIGYTQSRANRLRSTRAEGDLAIGSATEGPSFYRGAKPGEAPSFEPRPTDFKVDAATGTVKPTHGVSVFDNPGSVTSKGLVPHEVDLLSVPPELQIIQRGADPTHFEITPQVGSNLTPEQYKGLMCQIVCKHD